MLTELARETILQPRRLLARVLALPLAPAERWQGFAIVVLLSTLVSWLFLMAIDREGLLAPIMPGPVSLAFANTLLLLVLTAAIHLVGRGFGGHGTFQGAMVTVTILQAVMLIAQAVQMILLFVSVPVAELLGFVSLLLMIWLLANFIMALHGFQSLARVGLGILGVGIGLSMLLSAILMLAGLPGPGV